MKIEPTGLDWLHSDKRRERDLKLVRLTRPIADVVLNVTSEVLQLEGVGDIFEQQRVGKHGELFGMYKQRTMTGSDHHDSSIGERLATKTGIAARMFRIDEFPQLRNIEEGTMSAVGPRPLIRGDVVKMEASLTPGEFGPWWEAITSTEGGVVGYFALIANALVEAGRMQNQSLQFYQLRAMLDRAYVFEKASERFDNHLARRASLRTVTRLGHVITRRLGDHELVTDFRVRSRKLLDYIDNAA